MEPDDFNDVVPEWDDVPEDDGAEPDDLMVEHSATPEDVQAILDSGEPDLDETEDEDADEFVPVDRGGNPLEPEASEAEVAEEDEA